MSKEIINREKCLEYLNNFISELKNEKGSIQDYYKERDKKYPDIFKEFFFGNLYLNKTYGYKEDADRSELTKVLLYLYYDSILKEISSAVKITLELEQEKWILRDGSGKTGYFHTIYFNGYPLSNGDTLNTFATIFSKTCEISMDGLIHDRTTGISQKLIGGKPIPEENFEKFYKDFHRIGNFMLLPNNIKYEKKTSLNTFRAGWNDSCGWYDYFDLFLKAIKIWYETFDYTDEDKIKKLQSEFSNPKSYEKFAQLMNQEHNKEYFTALGSFENFVKFNCLEDYLNENIGQLHKDNKIYYHWMEDVSSSEYFEFTKNYVDVATKIIDNRSKQIIDRIFSDFYVKISD